MDKSKLILRTVNSLKTDSKEMVTVTVTCQTILILNDFLKNFIGKQFF